ncbi:MAG: right-handed parallel beta-helix repeat-containing protein [Myxococcaceae bacterium]|nr:right-handed parallel beta-helix repeat-containing protein [Myxococcaceae bacterium]
MRARVLLLAAVVGCGGVPSGADGGSGGGGGSGGSTGGGSAGGSTAGGSAGGSTSGGSAGGSTAGGPAGGSTAGGSAGGSTGGGSAGGSTAGGSAGGSTAGGSAGGSTGGGSAGGSTAGGSAGGSTAGGSAGGSTAGGSAGGSAAGGSAAGGSAGGAAGGSAGGAGGGSACPALVLGTAMEDVYVDQTAPAGGTGTQPCPFRTILEALALPAPGNGVTLRTVRVRGQAGGRTYTETSPLVIPSRVEVTSDYPGGPVGAANVTVSANGVCVTGQRCAVLLTGGRLTGVTVIPSSGPACAGVVTQASPSTSSISGCVIRNATQSGIVALGQLSISNTTSRSNQGNGLEASSTTPAIVSFSASGLAGLVNVFSQNTQSGLNVTGLSRLSAQWLFVEDNLQYGLYLDTPGVTHSVSNVTGRRNGRDGLHVVNGHVTLFLVSGGLNEFSSNGGAGAVIGTGDPLSTVGARLTALGVPGGSGGLWARAHDFSSNDGGGVLIQGPTGEDGGFNMVSSSTVRSNGNFGVRVAPVVAAPIRLQMRGTEIVRTRQGIGFTFRRVTGANDELDLGPAGANTFAPRDGGLNAVAALCLDNASGLPWTQAVEGNHWSLPCPLPLTDAGYQAQVPSCAQPPGTYREILFTGPTAPISSVASCQ